MSEKTLDKLWSIPCPHWNRLNLPVKNINKKKVWNMFRLNNKSTKMTYLESFMVFLLLPLNIFHTFDFEQVNISWDEMSWKSNNSIFNCAQKFYKNIQKKEVVRESLEDLCFLFFLNSKAKRQKSNRRTFREVLIIWSAIIRRAFRTLSNTCDRDFSITISEMWGSLVKMLKENRKNKALH